MTPTAADPIVAAFDLDGTLVRGSSFGQFVRLLICASPWRLAVAVAASPVAVILLIASLPGQVGGFVSYLAGGTSQNPSGATRRPYVASAFVWLATVGRSQGELRRRARTFGGFHAGPQSGNRIGVALARLAEHQDRDHRVVVVTAAVEPVASEVVRALGIRDAEVVAPRLRPRCCGWIPETNRRGAGKLDRLVAAGYRLPIDYAYTDSADDIALLSAARHRAAVEPRSRHWRALRAAVSDCTILTSDGLR